MEKKTENTPNASLRRFLRVLVPGVSGIAWTIVAACRRALSPSEQERLDNSMTKDIVKELTNGIQNPPPAQQDLENPKRFTVILPVTFPELTEVSDGAMRRAQQTYNADPANNPRKSKVLQWTRTDDRSFNVEMEFYSSQR